MSVQQLQIAGKNLSRAKNKGFTLTEIAIVLGIIGLILGSIWAAAASVYSNMKYSDAQKGITAVAQAVRGIFATSTNGFTVAGSIQTPGMFPISWNDPAAANTYKDPWGGAANINSAAVASTVFAISLANVPEDSCYKLLNFFGASATAQVTGLVGANITAAGPGAAVGGFALPTTCPKGGGGSVSIVFDMSKM